MTAAASLEIFDPKSNIFSSISLPRIGEINEVAVLQDGVIAVAITDETGPSPLDDTLVLISPIGVEQTVHTAATFVSTNGTVLIAGGVTGRAEVSQTGTISSLDMVANGTRVLPNVGAVGADGRAVLGTSNGIAVVSTTMAEYIDFPEVSCPGVALPPLQISQPNSITPRCGVSPIAVAVDIDWNIWVAPNLPQDEVGLIPAAA